MLRENLLKLNFTPNQADVYLSLLETGETKVGSLIQKTKFHRNIVYRALDDLITRKIVSRITKRGVFYYKTLSPEVIIQELKNQQDIAKEAISQIKEIDRPSESEIIVLSGQQGLIDTYKMFLDQGDDVYVLGALFNLPQKYTSGNLDETKQKELSKILEQFKKNKIKHYALAQSSVKNDSDFIKNKTFVDHLRFLPKNLPPSPFVIWISGKIVAHVLWEKPETIFVIKNKKIADSHKEYFNLLWKQAKA